MSVFIYDVADTIRFTRPKQQ